MTNFSEEDLFALVRREMKLPADYALSIDLDAEQVPGWDSMSWLNVINAIEGDYAVQFPLDMLVDLKTIGELYALASECMRDE